MIRAFFVVFWLSLLTACVHKQLQVGVVWQARSENLLIPLYIEMPRNNKAIEHVGPLLYEELICHFTQVGYKLCSRSYQGYRLAVDVIEFYPERKIVSPDVLLFHATFRLRCHCTVYNDLNEIVFSHTFSTSKLFSKPRNPVLSGNYFTHEFLQLLQGFVPMIEYRVRPYLIKKRV